MKRKRLTQAQQKLAPRGTDPEAARKAGQVHRRHLGGIQSPVIEHQQEQQHQGRCPPGIVAGTMNIASVWGATAWAIETPATTPTGKPASASRKPARAGERTRPAAPPAAWG